MKIKYEYDECSNCGDNKLITNKSKKLCDWCNKKIKNALYQKRRKERAKKGGLVDKAEMGKFLKKYWNTHLDRRCYETREPIRHYRSWHMHHLLEKSKYPEFAYKEDNIVYLTKEQHDLWHSLTMKKRPEVMPRTWARYLKIKQKYVKET